MPRRERMQRANRIAQERLTALGRPGGPLEGAEYRLRKAIAEGRGLSAAQGVGKPRKGELPIRELERRGAAPAKAPRSTHFRGGKAPAVRNVAGGRVVTTASGRTLKTELKRAAAEGQPVAIYVTGSKNGGPVRTHIIDGRGDQRAAIAQGAAGDPLELGGSEGTVQIHGKTQMVVGAQFMTNGGIDAQDLLDFLDAYDDTDDALGDLWDTEY